MAGGGAHLPLDLFSLIFSKLSLNLRLRRSEAVCVSNKISGRSPPIMAAAAGGGWADLPLDLFSLIFSKLSFPQLLRSAAVCVSWSAAAHELSTPSRRGFKPQGQSPWLMFGGSPDGDHSAATFYTLDERREYTIPLPDPPISRRILIGSSHGWVITADTHSGLLQLQLLNPITGAQIDLPSFVSANHLNIIHGNDERSIAVLAKPGYLHLKATLSADPSLVDDYTVAFVHQHLPIIYFTHSGHLMRFSLTSSTLIEDVLFHKGKLYATTITGSVQVCFIDHAQLRRGELPTFTSVVPSSSNLFHFHYLAETPRGDLLNIRRKRDRHHVTVFVEVYRLRPEEEIPNRRIEQVKDLGGLIIFLGSNRSLCLSASDFPHLTPNSIYFTDDLRLFYRRQWIMSIEAQIRPGESQSGTVSADVGIYSMTDHTFTRILPGDLRLDWPPPVWFILD